MTDDFLPTFEDLSAEQEAIFRLPLDDTSLVTGPPGTGKTVLALYRAERLMKTDAGFRIVTFSRPLKAYILRAATALAMEGQVATYWSFLGKWWRQRQRSNLPMEAKWQPDWNAIFGRLGEAPKRGTYAHLIVDEAQDIHPMFWFLRPWMAESVTVFADENQRISKDNSTVAEITANAQIAPGHHHTLTRNYRNTKEIHAVAARLAPDPSALADPPEKTGDRPELIRFDRDAHEADHIARLAANRPNWQIGVLAPSEPARKRLVNQLQHRLQPKGIRVDTYSAKLGQMNIDLDWSGPAVTVINWESAKGLQFDHVVIPRLEMARRDPSQATTRMLLFVLVTRASTNLTISWNGKADEDLPAFARLLPLDLMDVEP